MSKIEQLIATFTITGTLIGAGWSFSQHLREEEKRLKDAVEMALDDHVMTYHALSEKLYEKEILDLKTHLAKLSEKFDSHKSCNRKHAD